MNGIVICIFLFLLSMDLSMADFFILAPSNVSQDKILLSFKAASLGECVRKCKETPYCEDATSIKSNNKKSLDCYILASNKSDGDDETFLEMPISCSVDVSPFTFCFIWNGLEIKLSSEDKIMEQSSRCVHRMTFNLSATSLSLPN